MKTPILFLFFAVTAAVYAQEPAQTLDTLRTNYDVAVSELELPLSAWHQKYVGQLNIMKGKAQQAGDLDQLLAIQQEVEGMGGAINPSYTSLTRLRGIYDERRTSIEQDVAVKRRQIMGDYHRQLSAMQIRLTQSGAIEEALKVRDEINDVEMQAKAGISTSRKRVRSVGGNERPGRLIVFGTGAEEGLAVPADAERKPFVRVFANHQRYYAVNGKGEIFARPGMNRDHQLPDGKLEAVADVSVGTYVSIMLNADGSLTKTKSGWNEGLIPEGNDFVKIACGNTTNAALKRNGDVVAFGYSLKNREFVRPEWLKNVADVVVSGDVFIFKHRDGAIRAVHYRQDQELGNRPDGLDGHVIAMAAGTHSSCVFLTDEAKVICWNAGSPPADLENIRQIRAGHHIYAAQRADGTWVTWGSDSTDAKLNEALKRLGPLKDLDLGRDFFVGIK